MSTAAPSRERIHELRREVISAADPFALAADALERVERLQLEVARLERLLASVTAPC